MPDLGGVIHVIPNSGVVGSGNVIPLSRTALVINSCEESTHFLPSSKTMTCMSGTTELKYPLVAT